MDRRPDSQISRGLPYQPSVGRYPYKIHNLERKPNEELVQKLFLLVEEGNLFKIKDYLSSNKLTTLVRTDTGETLLHIVIKSSNLTKENKLELVKYLIDRGSPISLSDNNNVTPLHLASQLQLKNIIELLIKAGANINVIDNQGMTPLHYQILNENEQCKTEKNIKIGPLIPERINKEQINDDFKKIGSEILPVIYNDPDINRFIKHIRNTIKNLHNMYPQQVYDLQNKYALDVSEKIIDQKINDNEKYNKILASIQDNSISLDKLISDNLKKTLNKLDIHPNYPNGWGPDNNPINNILPHKDIGVIYEEIEQDIYDNIADTFIELRSQMGIITNDLSILNAYYDDMEDILLSIKDTNLNNIGRFDLENIYAGNIPFTGANVIINDYNVHRPSFIYRLPIHDANVLINDVGTRYGSFNNGYYFISNYKFLLNRLDEILRNIRANIENLDKFLGSETIYATYDILYSNVIVLIHSSILHLIVIGNETPYIRNKLALLNEANERYNANNIRQDISNDIINVITPHINAIEKKMPEMYITLSRILNQMNNVVSIINKISALRFIRQYHNDQDTPVLLQRNTNILNNFFDRNLYPSPGLPPRLRDYQKDIDITIRQTIGRPPDLLNNVKRRVWEIYLPQFSFINFASFYTNDSGTPIKEGTSGRNLGIAINTLDTPSVRIVNVHPLRNPLIGFAISLQQMPQFSTIPALKYNNRTKFYSKDINNLQVSPNRIGQIGIIPVKQVDKEIAAQPTVAILLDEHLFIIKYIILQHFISNIRTFLNLGNVNIPLHYRNIIKSIKDFVNKQKIELSLDDVNESMIYTLIARMVDISIINYIKSCIREASLENIHAVTRQVSNIGNFYADIADNIIKNKRLILLNYETDYKLSLDETINSIITKFFNPMNDRQSIELNYTALLLREKEQIDPNQHIIYNYSFSTKAYEKRCYIVDPDITKLLINNNARINQKDFSGNTPIYYAIELQNLEVVNILINYNASVNNSLSRNLIGLTPLLHTLKLYQAHLDILQNIDKLSDQLFDKVITYIKNKPEYKNNILKYSNNIFKEVVLIINHHFYLLMKQYKKNWTYEKYKIFLDNFQSIIDINDPINKFVPLLQYDRSLIQNQGIGGTNVLKDNIDYINIQISQTIQTKSELQQQIKNLQAEKNDIQDKLSDKYYKDRDIEINNLIADLIKQITEKDKNLNNLNNLLQKITTSSSRLTTNNIAILNNRANVFISRGINDAVSLYDKIFTDVVNYQKPIFKYTPEKDLSTYLILWDNYINDPSRQNNITQLHLLINKYQYNIITNYINKTGQIDINTLQKILGNIKELHQNIIGAFALDYEQLPNEYNKNTNYALTIVLDIITHVVRHNLCTIFYITIIKLLSKYVESINIPNRELFTPDQYSTYLTGVIRNIINVGTRNESLLMKYIVGSLPKKLTKFILNIYESEYDPDRSITSFDPLFDNIINILSLNKTVPINNDSIIVEQLRSYIFPYFKDMFEIFIKEMKNMTDSYMRYIISELKQIEILSVIINKAIQEKDIK